MTKVKVKVKCDVCGKETEVDQNQNILEPVICSAECIKKVVKI